MPSTFSLPNQIASKTFFPLTAVSHTLKMYNQADSKKAIEGEARGKRDHKSLFFLRHPILNSTHSIVNIKY